MHQSVLLKETIEGLDIRGDDLVVDGTLGRAGHAVAAIERARECGAKIFVIGIDRDDDALIGSKASLEKACAASGSRFRLFKGNFRDMGKFIAEASEETAKTTADKIILDLGVSSPQIDSSGRGFSFRNDEPLLMTMEKEPSEGSFTARDVVNGWAEEDIANVIYAYGEERYARRIARSIIASRESRPIETTGELAAIIESAVPAMYRRGKIHPATRTFQAIRIAVNDELGGLKAGLQIGLGSLAPAGRLAVISFHSLEDRIVKTAMREWKASGLGDQSTKKPITPSEEEIARNPRSRSAKLRIFIKH
ncbi:MAG: 16S rRNA (cytosine(1402)-N(4))-methyltransferase RsmH [Patescibacteria group bacterium]|nr:16S rRNA (cytosine(1402)-N(4))-methyltransferase RsmH [Patescibacteria group bacterium]MDE2116900.1 16S rRNA (cytosine(1402)-N(4))-methyltransferase RsmH [Patescibacteria group bacterium]